MSYRPGLTIDQYYNSWTATNLNPKYPIAESGTYFSTNAVINSWAMENGSFLKCRYLNLGYTFNPSLLQKTGLNKLHLYMQMVNLFTITKYTGLDPELIPSSSNLPANQQSAGFGVDYGNYPNTERKFILGINLSF